MKLMMSYGIPRDQARAMAALHLARYGRYGMRRHLGDEPGLLDLAAEFHALGLEPSITRGLLYIRTIGLTAPAVRRAK